MIAVLVISKRILFLHTHYANGGKIPPGLSRVPGHLRTKFQRLYPCFRGRAVQWCCRRCHQSPEVALYRQHNRKSHYTGNTYSGCVGDNVVESGDVEKMDLGVGILFLAVLCAETVLLLVWVAAISISGITRLPVTSSTTPLNSSTSKTWGIAVGILLLCAIELEPQTACILPV